MGRSQVRVRVDAFNPVERELGMVITVALGMPANERMDLLVEKATELGVQVIQPLQCERSVLRLAGDRALRKRAHWQGIAVAAAEQCGRNRVPEVAAVQTLDAFLAQLPAPGLRLLLSPGEGVAALHEAAADAQALLTLSGPEGGLTGAEENAALARGFVRARLGGRLLRAETAPLAVLAWAGLKEP
jgi:16S rRNA (uracil1498-N3)-methyltransferase